jgi:hypothetical protein
MHRRAAPFNKLRRATKAVDTDGFELAQFSNELTYFLKLWQMLEAKALVVLCLIDRPAYLRMSRQPHDIDPVPLCILTLAAPCMRASQNRLNFQELSAGHSL